MKSLSAALALACMAAQAAPPVVPAMPAVPVVPPGAVEPVPVQAAPELRQVLRQYHPERDTVQRELTPVERAELRKQLSEAPARRGR